MATTQATFEQLKHAGLEEIDPDIAALLTKELERQRGQIELIASENFSGRFYNVVHYGVSPETMLVDYDDVLAKAKEARPKVIVCGGSAYPRTVETDKFRAIADEVGALLLCDMAHFAGLVAAGLQPNPVEHCDFVTSTTHKTLAGPRAGFILCREQHAAAVDKAVFPGMQGGPLEHTIAAKATCFKIAMTDAFREYQR